MERSRIDQLPAGLRDAIPASGLAPADRWWSSLDPADRDRIAGLWDERLEVHFFTPQADETGTQDDWDQLPRVAGGRFVPSEDDMGRAEWGPGYFEHLLQHPELLLAYEPAHRTFHIGCTV